MRAAALPFALVIAFGAACGGTSGAPSSDGPDATPSPEVDATGSPVVPELDGGTEPPDEPPPAGPGTRPLRVIQYNLTGHARPLTEPATVPANGGSPEALAYLEWEMRLFPAVGSAIPDVVMLEEVCHSQFADLAARYTPDPSKTYVVHSPFMQVHPLCAGANKSLGQALLSPWPIDNVARTELGDTDTRFGSPEMYIVFKMLCGDVHVPDLPRPVRACVTHLRGASGVPVDTYKGQVDKIAAVLDPLVVGGAPVVFGGDLNNKPEYRTLDPLYRLDRVGGTNGRGHFDEADQTDRRWVAQAPVACTPTACRSGQRTTAKLDADGVVRDYYKFDYVFFSAPIGEKGFTDLSAAAMPFVKAPYPSRSDHHLYRAQAVLHY